MTERSPFNPLGAADPVHPKMSETRALGVPCHKIPKRRQDQQGLWFNLAVGLLTLGITLEKPQMQALQKRRLERGQQIAVHRANIGKVLQGR